MAPSPNHPHRLRTDNFTPPTRTPWGGRKILERYKRDLGLDLPSGLVVGESWEFSVEPSFPSRLERGGPPLVKAIRSAPRAWLGDAVAAAHGGQTPLLVKLLDSGDNLSVQVHPREDDPNLGPAESGKPESWLILESEPEAGIYLGFRDGVTRADVEACLGAEGELDALLNFVAVSPGDFFVIEAGTPHAIGKGVTLVEPQFVSPGRKGVTYRFWDWNRRYDALGHPDPAGAPRELHVARSLKVTRWDAPRGQAFVATCRPPRSLLADSPVRREVLLDWPWFHVELWQGTGTLRVESPDTLWALTCVAGRATLAGSWDPVTLPKGQSAVVPAAAGDLTLTGEGMTVVATRSVV